MSSESPIVFESRFTKFPEFANGCALKDADGEKFTQLTDEADKTIEHVNNILRTQNINLGNNSNFYNFTIIEINTKLKLLQSCHNMIRNMIITFLSHYFDNIDRMTYDVNLFRELLKYINKYKKSQFNLELQQRRIVFNDKNDVVINRDDGSFDVLITFCKRFLDDRSGDGFVVLCGRTFVNEIKYNKINFSVGLLHDIYYFICNLHTVFPTSLSRYVSTHHLKRLTSTQSSLHELKKRKKHSETELEQLTKFIGESKKLSICNSDHLDQILENSKRVISTIDQQLTTETTLLNELSLSQNTITSLAVQANVEKSINICTICMENQNSHALTCGHVMCGNCINKLKTPSSRYQHVDNYKCPFCNVVCTNIDTVISPLKLFLSS